MYYLPEILWRNKGDSSLLWASGEHINACGQSCSGRRPINRRRSFRPDTSSDDRSLNKEECDTRLRM